MRQTDIRRAKKRKQVNKPSNWEVGRYEFHPDPDKKEIVAYNAGLQKAVEIIDTGTYRYLQTEDTTTNVKEKYLHKADIIAAIKEKMK